MLTTLHEIHFSLPEGHYRESCQKQTPEESQGAMHTAAAVGIHHGSSAVEYELTEVTPCYCTYTTTQMACRRTEKEKEKEPVTCFFFPTLKFKVYFNAG